MDTTYSNTEYKFSDPADAAEVILTQRQTEEIFEDLQLDETAEGNEPCVLGYTPISVDNGLLFRSIRLIPRLLTSIYSNRQMNDVEMLVSIIVLLTVAPFSFMVACTPLVLLNWATLKTPKRTRSNYHYVTYDTSYGEVVVDHIHSLGWKAIHEHVKGLDTAFILAAAAHGYSVMYAPKSKDHLGLEQSVRHCFLKCADFPRDTPLHINIPIAPVAVRNGGRTHIVIGDDTWASHITYCPCEKKVFNTSIRHCIGYANVTCVKCGRTFSVDTFNEQLNMLLCSACIPKAKLRIQGHRLLVIDDDVWEAKVDSRSLFCSHPFLDYFLYALLHLVFGSIAFLAVLLAVCDYYVISPLEFLCGRRRARGLLSRIGPIPIPYQRRRYENRGLTPEEIDQIIWSNNLPPIEVDLTRQDTVALGDDVVTFENLLDSLADHLDDEGDFRISPQITPVHPDTPIPRLDDFDYDYHSAHLTGDRIWPTIDQVRADPSMYSDDEIIYACEKASYSPWLDVVHLSRNAYDELKEITYRIRHRPDKFVFNEDELCIAYAQCLAHKLMDFCCSDPCCPYSKKDCLRLLKLCHPTIAPVAASVYAAIYLILGAVQFASFWKWIPEIEYVREDDGLRHGFRMQVAPTTHQAFGVTDSNFRNMAGRSLCGKPSNVLRPPHQQDGGEKAFKVVSSYFKPETFDYLYLCMFIPFVEELAKSAGHEYAALVVFTEFVSYMYEGSDIKFFHLLYARLIAVLMHCGFYYLSVTFGLGYAIMAHAFWNFVCISIKPSKVPLQDHGVCANPMVDYIFDKVFESYRLAHDAGNFFLRGVTATWKFFVSIGYLLCYYASFGWIAIAIYWFRHWMNETPIVVYKDLDLRPKFLEIAVYAAFCIFLPAVLATLILFMMMFFMHWIMGFYSIVLLFLFYYFSIFSACFHGVVIFHVLWSKSKLQNITKDSLAYNVPRNALHRLVYNRRENNFYLLPVLISNVLDSIHTVRTYRDFDHAFADLRPTSTIYTDELLADLSASYDVDIAMLISAPLFAMLAWSGNGVWQHFQATVHTLDLMGQIVMGKARTQDVLNYMIVETIVKYPWTKYQQYSVYPTVYQKAVIRRSKCCLSATERCDKHASRFIDRKSYLQLCSEVDKTPFEVSTEGVPIRFDDFKDYIMHYMNRNNQFIPHPHPVMGERGEVIWKNPEGETVMSVSQVFVRPKSEEKEEELIPALTKDVIDKLFAKYEDISQIPFESVYDHLIHYKDNDHYHPLYIANYVYQYSHGRKLFVRIDGKLQPTDKVEFEHAEISAHSIEDDKTSIKGYVVYNKKACTMHFVKKDSGAWEFTFSPVNWLAAYLVLFDIKCLAPIRCTLEDHLTARIMKLMIQVVIGAFTKMSSLFYKIYKRGEMFSWQSVETDKTKRVLKIPVAEYAMGDKLYLKNFPEDCECTFCHLHSSVGLVPEKEGFSDLFICKDCAVKTTCDEFQGKGNKHASEGRKQKKERQNVGTTEGMSRGSIASADTHKEKHRMTPEEQAVEEIRRKQREEEQEREVQRAIDHVAIVSEKTHVEKTHNFVNDIAYVQDSDGELKPQLVSRISAAIVGPERPPHTITASGEASIKARQPVNEDSPSKGGFGTTKARAVEIMKQVPKWNPKVFADTAKTAQKLGMVKRAPISCDYIQQHGGFILTANDKGWQQTYTQSMNDNQFLDLLANSNISFVCYKNSKWKEDVGEYGEPGFVDNKETRFYMFRPVQGNNPSLAVPVTRQFDTFLTRLAKFNPEKGKDEWAKSVDPNFYDKAKEIVKRRNYQYDAYYVPDKIYAYIDQPDGTQKRVVRDPNYAQTFSNLVRECTLAFNQVVHGNNLMKFQSASPLGLGVKHQKIGALRHLDGTHASYIVLVKVWVDPKDGWIASAPGEKRRYPDEGTQRLISLAPASDLIPYYIFAANRHSAEGDVGIWFDGRNVYIKNEDVRIYSHLSGCDFVFLDCPTILGGAKTDLVVQCGYSIKFMTNTVIYKPKCNENGHYYLEDDNYAMVNMMAYKDNEIRYQDIGTRAGDCGSPIFVIQDGQLHLLSIHSGSNGLCGFFAHFLAQSSRLSCTELTSARRGGLA